MGVETAPVDCPETCRKSLWQIRAPSYKTKTQTLPYADENTSISQSGRQEKWVSEEG
jgi:hypothetical protein